MSTAVVPARFTRHDLLLAVIAASLAVAALIAVASGLSIELALAAGSVPAGAGLGYALFYRPPVQSDG